MEITQFWIFLPENLSKNFQIDIDVLNQLVLFLVEKFVFVDPFRGSLGLAWWATFLQRSWQKFRHLLARVSLRSRNVLSLKSGLLLHRFLLVLRLINNMPRPIRSIRINDLLYSRERFKSNGLLHSSSRFIFNLPELLKVLWLFRNALIFFCLNFSLCSSLDLLEEREMVIRIFMTVTFKKTVELVFLPLRDLVVRVLLARRDCS